jgi:hypothetical protein
MMKKTLALLVMLLLFAACNDSKKSGIEETSEYTELSNYNGGVVTSKMRTVINGKKVYSFNILMPGKTSSDFVPTSEELFEMFSTNDTIRVGGSLESVMQAPVETHFESAREDILNLQNERNSILNDIDTKNNYGIIYSAVILIDNKPYMITIKRIGQ